jgi:EAL domain-containing protein (putative c-di-GMP-specific phosphodiesterase class I)
VIQAVVDIASALGITTVAEGVETEQEADRLRALGCTEVQGYLYGRPSSSADLDDLLVELGLVRAPHLRSVDATEGPRIWHSA